MRYIEFPSNGTLRIINLDMIAYARINPNDKSQITFWLLGSREALVVDFTDSCQAEKFFGKLRTLLQPIKMEEVKSGQED